MKRLERRGRGSKSSLPRARQDVLTMDVADEVVVYDKKGHHGHCLNRPAAIVWRHLDGRTSMKELVARLRKDLNGPADEDTVWLALKELDKAELLEDGFGVPAAHDVSRREALRRFGVAAAGGAVLLPAITSLVAPPVHAQISAVGCVSQGGGNPRRRLVQQMVDAIRYPAATGVEFSTRASPARSSSWVYSGAAAS